jgi:cell division protein FtsB
MSDANYEFEDDAVQDQQQSKDPVRAHLRKLEAENKALREQAAEADAARRELNFVKAGVDPKIRSTSISLKATTVI